MARKRSSAPSPASKPITAERAARLYRLLTLLGAGPQTRATLIKKLKLDVRGFYRDLEVLRLCGIALTLREGRYVLEGKPADTLARLPFPDPYLTLGEAQLLAKGRTVAHRKIRKQVLQIVG